MPDRSRRGQHHLVQQRIRVDGAGSDGATIFLKDSAITFSANGTNYRLAVPAAAISFDPGATAALGQSQSRLLPGSLFLFLDL
jgi:hypothetical protein